MSIFVGGTSIAYLADVYNVYILKGSQVSKFCCGGYFEIWADSRTISDQHFRMASVSCAALKTPVGSSVNMSVLSAFLIGSYIFLPLFAHGWITSWGGLQALILTTDLQNRPMMRARTANCLFIIGGLALIAIGIVSHGRDDSQIRALTTR